VSEHDLWWLAGLIDGEGTVTVRRSKQAVPEPYLSIEMTHEPTIQRAAALIREVGCHAYTYGYRARSPRFADSYHLRVGRTADLMLLAQVLGPRSTTKREQWTLLGQFCLARMERSGALAGRAMPRGMHAVPPSQLELDIAAQMRELNRKGPR